MATPSPFVSFKDWDYNPKHTPEEVQVAEKWLEENRPSFSYTTNFVIVSEGGKVVSYFNQACHAALGFICHPLKSRSLFATEIGITRRSYPSVDNESRLFFLHWFLYESFASPFIVNKDNFEFCRDYGIIVNCDISPSLLQNIAIVSRHFYELSPGHFAQFKKLCDEGYPKHLAYLLACNTSRLDFNSDQHLLASTTGHRAWGYPPSLEALQVHMDGKFFDTTLDEKELARYTASIYGGNTLGYPQEANGLSQTGFIHHCFREAIEKDKDLRDILSKHRNVGKDNLYHPPNPFAPRTIQKTDPFAPTYYEFYELILPAMKEKGYFNVSA